jgi:hypothetical protein
MGRCLCNLISDIVLLLFFITTRNSTEIQYNGISRFSDTNRFPGKRLLHMSSFYGYWGKVLHVDLSSHTWREEYFDEKWYRIYAGGGLMGTYFMLNETLPGVDPFAPENLLIFVSSVVAGLEAPGLARFSVVTKSPLSGGIAEARCEGGFGRSLKASGYDAILIHGRATRPVYLCRIIRFNFFCCCR